MVRLYPLALFAAVLAAFGPSPAEAGEANGTGKSFSLSVAEKPGHRRDFVRDWVAAHEKWGQGVSEEVLSTFSLLEDDGEVGVDPLGEDDIYVAEIEIGEPPQVVKIALDTGSSDFWVQSNDTTYSTNIRGPWALKYYPNASSTAQAVPDAEWRLAYMDGSRANGVVYLDTVRLSDDLSVENATVQSALNIASRFERELDLSGIMGLAKSLPSNVDPPRETFLEQLSPLLDRAVFTADLRRGEPGRFDFGYIDKSLFVPVEPRDESDGDGDDGLTWLDSDPSSPHWDINLDLTASGALENVTWWSHSFSATVDTGTTLMFLPDVLASMYWLAIPGVRVDPRLADAFTFPCHLADPDEDGEVGLPDLQIKLPRSEHVLTIPGSYLNYGPVEVDPGYCWGGLQSADGLDAVILGDVMLKAIFVAFDLEKGRVGFANKHLRDPR